MISYIRALFLAAALLCPDGAASGALDARILPRCLSLKCLFGATVFEVILECLLKGDCKRGGNSDEAAPNLSRPTQSEPLTTGSTGNDVPSESGRTTLCHRVRSCAPGRPNCMQQQHCRESDGCAWLTMCSSAK